MITAERLRQLLRYDPDTGSWTWLVSPSRNIKVGDLAGTTKQDGYRQLRVGGEGYLSARLAVLYMTGQYPVKQVDHANQIRWDDRWANLREATPSDNNSNRRLQGNNTSGYRGVSWDGISGKWDVRVNRIHIGFFDDIEEAVTVRDIHAQKMQGAFAVLNKPNIIGEQL